MSTATGCGSGESRGWLTLWSRNDFDDALPTLVRYAGFVASLVCIGFALAGHYIEAAAGLPAATGMLLYKTFREAARDA